MIAKVTIRYATIFGSILVGLGIVVPFIGQIADATSPLGVSPERWNKMAIYVSVAVIIGRMLQEVARMISNAMIIGSEMSSPGTEPASSDPTHSDQCDNGDR